MTFMRVVCPCNSAFAPCLKAFCQCWLVRTEFQVDVMMRWFAPTLRLKAWGTQAKPRVCVLLAGYWRLGCFVSLGPTHCCEASHGLTRLLGTRAWHSGLYGSGSWSIGMISHAQRSTAALLFLKVDNIQHGSHEAQGLFEGQSQDCGLGASICIKRHDLLVLS